MKPTEQTLQQISRALRKIAQKFPPHDEPSLLTDIHLRVSQDSGELVAFDDEDQEITRCVIEQWIDNKEENFYTQVTNLLRNETKKMGDTIDSMGIMPKAILWQRTKRCWCISKMLNRFDGMRKRLKQITQTNGTRTKICIFRQKFVFSLEK